MRTEAAMLFVLACPALAAAGQADQDVPPQEFVLDIEGKPVVLELEKPAEIQVGEQKARVTLSARPNRHFEKAGVSFLYPASFEFEVDNHQKDVTLWTISGRYVTFLLARYNKNVNHSMLRKFTVATMKEKFQDAKPKHNECALEFNGATHTGDRVEVTTGGKQVVQEIYSFSVEETPYTMMFTEHPKGEEQHTEEGKALRALLTKSFRITK